MPWRGPSYEGEFPSLGWLVGDWVESHCVIPDGEDAGRPYLLTDEMWRFFVRHYRLRLDAREASWQTAWQFNRSMLVRPQKWGKSPLMAALSCAEAVGPVLFAGWDAAGEPVGRPWPTAVIQVTASSEDQTDNVYKALRPMIDMGPLAEVIPDTGETRINLQHGGWIEPVTSKALSRLGARVTFVPQDEPGTWAGGSQLQRMAETQYRGLAGTGGRAVLITNGWDLAENSVAQQLAEAHEPDVLVDHVRAPESLSYTNKRDRERIHRIVYGDSAVKLDRHGVRVSGWVNLDRIEAEAAKLVRTDPAQAARFFGNIPSAGSGVWLQPGEYAGRVVPRDRPVSGPVCLGFDGSDVDDWSAIRLETFDRHLFTPLDGLGRRTVWNPAATGSKVPRLEVMAAFQRVFEVYDVVRAYLDPPLWASEISVLQGRYGDKRVVEWPTYRVRPMHAALERLRTDIISASVTFDRDPDADAHYRNAVVRARSGNTYILGKPVQTQKIDIVMSDVLAHEAVSDAIAAGDLARRGKHTISTTYYAFN